MSSRVKHVTPFRETAGVVSRPAEKWKTRKKRGRARSLRANEMNLSTLQTVRSMFASPKPPSVFRSAVKTFQQQRRG